MQNGSIVKDHAASALHERLHENAGIFIAASFKQLTWRYTRLFHSIVIATRERKLAYE
ncbi:MAG TPA: hypothetical protein VGL97_16895 [Bryobacteraceae bacterium]